MPRYSYSTRTPRAATNPFRSNPLLASAAPLLHRMAQIATPALLPSAPVPARAPRPLDADQTPWHRAAAAVRNARAHVAEMVRCYDGARREIGDMNRGISNGIRLVGATPERLRQCCSRVFRLFNRRRGQLAQARKRLAAAEAALALIPAPIRVGSTRRLTPSAPGRSPGSPGGAGGVRPACARP